MDEVELQARNILQPLVGISVLVLKEGRALLGRRLSSHGTGEFAFPGGHLEHLEGFEACVARELAEECGITVRNVRFLTLSNVTAYAPKHYVHIGFVADHARGEPRVLEPENVESWAWYPLDALPMPLFQTIPSMLEAYRTGVYYQDSTATP